MEFRVKREKKAINNHKNKYKITTPVNSTTDPFLIWFKPEYIPHEAKIKFKNKTIKVLEEHTGKYFYKIRMRKETGKP